jgi:hypothetical protein
VQGTRRSELPPPLPGRVRPVRGLRRRAPADPGGGRGTNLITRRRLLPMLLLLLGGALCYLLVLGSSGPTPREPASVPAPHRARQRAPAPATALAVADRPACVHVLDSLLAMPACRLSVRVSCQTAATHELRIWSRDLQVATIRRADPSPRELAVPCTELSADLWRRGSAAETVTPALFRGDQRTVALQVDDESRAWLAVVDAAGRPRPGAGSPTPRSRWSPRSGSASPAPTSAGRRRTARRASSPGAPAPHPRRPATSSRPTPATARPARRGSRRQDPRRGRWYARRSRATGPRFARVVRA